MVGRNAYASIAALAPGVTGSGQLFASGAAFGTDSFQAEPGYQINAAGQRQEQNEYDVDGTSVNGNSRDGIANLTPEPDTIQEIRVSANSFSAEKGRNSGALVEVFTKSGMTSITERSPSFTPITPSPLALNSSPRFLLRGETNVASRSVGP